MTDLYAKCPCGSGKKIKFCCKDIIQDIEKIERMLAGDQRNAALDKIEKLLKKHPRRPALLALKAKALIDQELLEEAEVTAEQLLEADPENHTGYALKANIAAEKLDSQTAVRSLHKAIYHSGGFSRTVYEAYITTCFALLKTSHPAAAYAHGLTLFALSQGKDQFARDIIRSTTQGDGVSPLLMGQVPSDESPEDASWKREFDLAMSHFAAGDWSTAADLCEGMNRRILDEPILLQNQAILNAWCGETEKAIKAFRALASVRELSEEQAIDAEALALNLEASDPKRADAVDLVELACDIDDADSMMETLLSHTHVENASAFIDPEDSPPPKGLFFFFDRPIPSGDAQLEHKDLPREIATIRIDGKQTDQPARIVCEVHRDRQFESVVKTLNELPGCQFSADTARHLLSVPMSRYLFMPRTWQTADADADLRQEYEAAWVAEQVLQTWPELPLKSLDGKSLREASQDAKLKRRIQAIILNLELFADYASTEIDFNELRTQLGMPVPERLSPSGDIRDYTASELLRLDLEKLSSEDLVTLFKIVAPRPTRATWYRVSKEIYSREDISEDLLSKTLLFSTLAKTCPTTKLGLEYVRQARDLAIERGESTAEWLIAELDFRILRREMAKAQQLVHEIQQRFGNDPGVAAMFSEVLERHGISTAPRAPSAPRQPIAAGTGAAATANPPAAEGIWTPDGPSEPAPTTPTEPSESESKIWMPGMD